MLKKQEKRLIRHRRVRAKMHGTAKRPRLCVFRSAKHIYAQLIDDVQGKTIVVATGKANIAQAKKVGKLIAGRALEKKIEKVVFDRGGYKYHGKVKAVAEGAREGGLKF